MLKYNSIYLSIHLSPYRSIYIYKVKDIYIPKVDFVYVNQSIEDTAKIMSKYDLEAIPVVSENKILLGRITIDDIVDIIKEEANKDYQLAAGISNLVASSLTPPVEKISCLVLHFSQIK